MPQGNFNATCKAEKEVSSNNRNTEHKSKDIENIFVSVSVFTNRSLR